MLRMVPAVPAVPITTAGMIRCLSRSQIFAGLHDAIAYSRENRPICTWPVQANHAHTITSASRKLGTARPMKPMKVAT